MTTTTMVERSAQLEYAPGAPVRRRKRIRRAVALVLLLALGFVGYRYGPATWGRVVLLWEQHRCLAYTAPADQVVYDEASPTTADRAKQAGFELYNMSPRAGNTMTAAVKHAPPLVTFARRLPPPLPLPAPTWMMMSGYGGGGVALPRSLGTPLGATLFLHELRNKAGQRRLCVVQRVPTENGPFVYPFALQIALYEPAGLWSDIKYASTPPRMTNYFNFDGAIPLVPVKPLKFYAGQADPNDPARFTIRYELDGKAGVVDGRLNESGDDVSIKIVSGPAMAPSLWTTFAVQQR